MTDQTAETVETTQNIDVTPATFDNDVSDLDARSDRHALSAFLESRGVTAERLRDAGYPSDMVDAFQETQNSSSPSFSNLEPVVKKLEGFDVAEFETFKENEYETQSQTSSGSSRVSNEQLQEQLDSMERTIESLRNVIQDSELVWPYSERNTGKGT